MEKEWNLSDKLSSLGSYEFYEIDDVKKFIKRLKSVIRRQKGDLEKQKLIKNIDKLAGEELI